MKWSSAIILLITSVLFVSCNVNEKSENDFSLQEKIEKSLLIKDLNAFNSGLAFKHNLPILYDAKSNTLIRSNLTRVNWRAFWIADAEGAMIGGKYGARFGSAFSPSGAIAGAVIGALLCGAASSALEEWIANGDEETAWAVDVCDAEAVSDQFYEIPLSELVDTRSSIEITTLEIDSISQAVGVAHNVLLDRMLEKEKSDSEYGEAEAGSEENGNSEIATLSLDDPIEEWEGDAEPDFAVSPFDVLYSDECVQVAVSEEYKEHHSSYLNKRLNPETDVDDGDNSMANIVMNLFFEASMLEGGYSGDIVSIANYYYGLVKDSSELSIEDKYAVCIGMAVASYSAKYWETR